MPRGKSVKRKGNSGARRPSRYRPDREPKLKAAPPPRPASVPAPEGFGSAEEDGLRLLAALETMETLEPDFGDQYAGEASVMIVERSAPAGGTEEADHEPHRFSSLQDRLSATFAEIEVEALAAAFCEPLGEAQVEIFETPEAEPESRQARATQVSDGHRACKK